MVRSFGAPFASRISLDRLAKRLLVVVGLDHLGHGRFLPFFPLYRALFTVEGGRSGAAWQ
jgi:hypothetical protein